MPYPVNDANFYDKLFSRVDGRMEAYYSKIGGVDYNEPTDLASDGLPSEQVKHGVPISLLPDEVQGLMP